MQGSTHLVTGILIQKSLKKIQPLPLQYSAVAALAILSHGILDRLARATFHPSSPLVNDPIWVISHLAFGILTVFIIVRFWRGFKLAMVCSVLCDLDWALRAVLQLCSLSFGSKPPLHTLLARFIDIFVPVKIWDVLPNWNLAHQGLIVEAVLFALLIGLIRVVGRRNPGAGAKPKLQG